MAKDLRDQVNKILDEYADDIIRVTGETAKSVADEAARKLKGSAPRSGRRGKHYAAGMAVKNTSTSRLYKSYTVYNKNKPQLTHLLEHGHAKVNGGSVPGTPHWEPAEANAVKEYEERIVRAIE